MGPDDDPVRVRIEGKSEARGVQSGDEHGFEGPLWQHEVKLTWEGIIEMKKDRMSRLLLVAQVPKNSSGGTFRWSWQANPA